MRVLITGGSGTVGCAFMREYADRHTFAILSRSEKLQWEAQQEFAQLKCYLGGVEDHDAVLRAYDAFQPDIVIHAAAIKHIDLAERQPIQTCRINIVGGINVVAVSKLCRTPITIGISTDKACGQSVYGMSKYLMEKAFLEANTAQTKFALCRFANVAKSNGSVIPKWIEAAKRGEQLTITDPSMCRMMISQPDAARLIHKAIDLCDAGGGFILSKKLKQVNILDLAKAISDNYKVTGVRAGEQQHEALFTPNEIACTELLPDGYIKIGTSPNPRLATRLDSGYDSATAERMTEQEIRDLIAA